MHLHSFMINRHQVEGDGKTVWVNGPDGCCVARFSASGGIDIHFPALVQMETGKQCHDCKPGPAGLEDWGHFIQKVKEIFDVQIPEIVCPATLKGAGASPSQSGL